jgi:hypothetical protein
VAYDRTVVPFCIDAAVLGTDRHLVCAESGYSWHVTVPAGTWHLSGQVKPDSDWCLDTALRLGGSSPDLSPPGRFVNAMALVMSGSSAPVPWQRVMPAGAHRAFVRGIIDQVAVAMAKAPVDYYRGTWVPGNAVIRSLRPARVDAGRFQALVAAGVGNLATVQTFAPDFRGYAMPVTYDRFGTLTGRLTVTKGPNILTLKREYRDLLVPAGDGCIVSVDFAALEVRVLLYEAGRRCDEPDLYAMIAREIGHDRKAVKGAVISELYGSSKFALGKVLGIEGRELNTFVKKVKAYFNTPALLKRIKAQFYETGRVINRYGRPVLIDEPQDHIFINYYAQSSGVDVTLLGFSQIVARLAEEAPGVRPLYLLHDALILDVPRRHLDQIMSVDHVFVPGYVQKFPIRAECVSRCKQESISSPIT